MAVGNANLLASSPTAQWLIENSPVKLQIARVWPFLGIAGGSITYPRENSTIGGAQIVNDGAAASDNSDVVDVDPNLQTFSFNEFITSYTVNYADQDRYQNPSDIDAVEYALALRRLLYRYFEQLDIDDGSPALHNLMDDDRKVDASGALTLDAMDLAYQRVVSNDGRPTIIMGSTRCLLQYQSLCRAAGYDVPYVPYFWYDPALGQAVPSYVPSFNGTPFLINDMMQGQLNPNEVNPAIQRIYFMVLGDDGKAGPTRGVTGIVPEPMRETMFVKRTTMGSPDFAGGNLNTAQVTWVSWPAGFAIGSQGAISLIHNFSVPQ